MKQLTKSLVSGVCFTATYIGLVSAGFVLTGAVFGVLGGIMLMATIYHCCKDIWEA